MGRFSTAAQYFLEPTGKLDDQSGKFEVGYTKASKKFLEELQETYIHPVWDLIKSGHDPILKMLGSADCTDEQLFKTMAMFWQFERSVGALHGTWLLGYTFGSKGEYQEVEYLEIRRCTTSTSMRACTKTRCFNYATSMSHVSCSPIHGVSSSPKH